MRSSVPLLLFLLLAPAALAGAPEERLVKRGDRFYERRGQGRRWCAKAIESYEKALALNPESVTASWKIARATYWLGVHTEETAEKLRIHKKGIDVAKRAIALDAKSVESHFWLGVSYGKYGEAKGVTNSLGLIDPIKAEMRKVIELDEEFEGGGAHRVLGRLYFKVPALLGGDLDKAEEHLKKAVSIDEGRLLNHLFLAEVYLERDEKEKAKRHLELVVDGEWEEHRRPENEEEKERAKALLGSLEESGE